MSVGTFFPGCEIGFRRPKLGSVLTLVAKVGENLVCRDQSTHFRLPGGQSTEISLWGALIPENHWEFGLCQKQQEPYTTSFVSVIVLSLRL